MELKKEVYLEDNDNLYPALKHTSKGNFYGYINEEGSFIIKPKFQGAYDFNGKGLAIVEVDNLMGFIDKKGEYIVKPSYDSISPFTEGRAIYVLQNFMGIMNEVGEVITKNQYQYVESYSEGIAKIGIATENGNYLYGYIDKSGREIIKPNFIEASAFKDGVALTKSKDGRYILIDTEGKTVANYDYPYVNNYGDGLLIFALTFDGLRGYINIRGEIVIQPKYTIAQGFKDGVAIVSTSQDYIEPNFGVIDINGEYIFNTEYNKIHNLGEDRLALGKPRSKKNILFSNVYAMGNTTGKILSEFKYLVLGNFEEGFSFGSNEEYTFFVGKDGKIKCDFPIVRGSGSIRVKRDMIYADIDYNPYYLRKDGRAIYKPNDTINLSSKYSIIIVKYKPNIDYLIYYPIIRGLSDRITESAVNKRLWHLSFFKPGDIKPEDTYVITPEDVLNYNYYGNFSVTMYKKNILVLELLGYYYPFGAAHGMSYKKTPVINLSTGQFYKLNDLFLGGVYWSGELNKIIEEKIKNDPQYESLFDGLFKGVNANQDFYIDGNNLYIYFPPYELAPYSSGFVTFKIPLKEIQGMLQEEFQIWS